MKISIVTLVSDDLTAAFENLIPQLSPEAAIPTKSFLEEITKSDNMTLFIAEDEGIVGTLTLAIQKIPTGKKAWIEDVVVDGSARGKGIGKKLIQHAIEYASESGVTKIDLTSSPFRTAANKLYEKMGFQKRDTNFYRLKLPIIPEDTH